MSVASGGRAGGVVESLVPARMDRLPWARWHWLVVMALGITWILDGLEVTVVSNIASRWTEAESGLGLADFQAGAAASIYLAGQSLGRLPSPT